MRKTTMRLLANLKYGIKRLDSARVENCGTRAEFDPAEHLLWPTCEFSLLKLEHNISSKRNSIISRYLDDESKEASLATRSFLSLISLGRQR